jgi:hypothetical protein
MEDNLINCVAEEKRLRQLQYDAEWSGDNEQADFYKKQANHYKWLITQGILLDPTF